MLRVVFLGVLAFGCSAKRECALGEPCGTFEVEFSRSVSLDGLTLDVVGDGVRCTLVGAPRGSSGEGGAGVGARAEGGAAGADSGGAGGAASTPGPCEFSAVTNATGARLLGLTIFGEPTRVEIVLTPTEGEPIELELTPRWEAPTDSCDCPEAREEVEL